MRLFLYCVYDSCAGYYDRPFCAQADGEAVRSFSDIAGDAEHPIGKHPEHYSLYRVGAFDNNTSKIVPEDAVVLAKAHELIALAQTISPGSLDKFEDERLKMNLNNRG